MPERRRGGLCTRIQCHERLHLKGESLELIREEVVNCVRCPRLVEWREAVAADPPARYRGEKYWARPVPGFGDPKARLLVVGLAPAANGGNRTGRVFTGDRSGEWLFRALHTAGFANMPVSTGPRDGLRLADCYVSAVVKCAPPANKPAIDERDRCLPYLVGEIQALRNLKVVLALGAFAWDGASRALKKTGEDSGRLRPKFGHGARAEVGDYVLLGSYHPSQQNTFTGKLTQPAFAQVFEAVRALLQ